MASVLGLKIVQKPCDFSKITHYIPSDGEKPILRTLKFMAAFSTTSNIVTNQWLSDSFSSNRLLPCNDYFINDKAAEKRYKFSMKQTIENGKLARESGGILQEYRVYLCKDISIKNKKVTVMPPFDEMEVLISINGATQVSIKEMSKYDDTSKLLIITSDPETKTQLKGKTLQSAIENGATKMTCTAIFESITNQKFELPGPSASVQPTPKKLPKTTTRSSASVQPATKKLPKPTGPAASAQLTPKKSSELSEPSASVRPAPKKSPESSEPSASIHLISKKTLAKSPNSPKTNAKYSIPPLLNEKLQFASPQMKEKALHTLRNFGFDLDSGNVTNVIDASKPTVRTSMKMSPFKTPTKKKAPTKKMTQMIKLFSTPVTRSPERTISDKSIVRH